MTAAPQAEGGGGSRRKRRGRGRHEALVSHERWIISYADFMTLLFALFVVLFAASVHSKALLGQLSGAIQDGFRGGAAAVPADGPAQEQGRSLKEAMEKQPDAASNAERVLKQTAGELRGVLGEAIASHEVSVTETREGLVLSFEEMGFFHSGEANVVAGQASKIVAAGAILQRHHLVVRVEGYSDDQPIHNAEFSSNWELSAARAMTVLLLLVDQTHYEPTRLSMAGYGPYRPVASNDTAAGRQKNRRVDLVVLRDQVPQAAP